MDRAHNLTFVHCNLKHFHVLKPIGKNTERMKSVLHLFLEKNNKIIRHDRFCNANLRKIKSNISQILKCGLQYHSQL